MPTNLNFGALELASTLEDRIGDITVLPVRRFATEAADGVIAALTNMQSDMEDSLAIMAVERAGEKPGKLKVKLAATYDPETDSVRVKVIWNERHQWKSQRHRKALKQLLPGVDPAIQAKN